MLFLSVACLLGAEGGGESAEITVESLAAAFDQWLAEVTFTCTYRTRYGYASSLEEALRMRLPDGEGKPHGELRTITGLWHKRGSQVHFSMDYGGPPVRLKPDVLQSESPPVSLSADQSAWTNVSEEQLRDGRLRAVYYPNRGAVNAIEELLITPDDTRGGGWLPVFLCGSSHQPNPFRMYDSIAGADKVRKSVTVRDPEHVEVVLAVESPSGSKYRSQLVFWTKPALPVIE
ncbi:MAG: hypothetical protein ACUVUC_06995 [Thermoguttaceae bacterium]